TYEAVKEAERAEAEAERRRLYYVAMTRAIDRLVVAGSIDAENPSETTPIGWVLGRLEARELQQASNGPLELERGGARLLVRLDRYVSEPETLPRIEPGLEAEPGQLELFAVENGRAVVADAPVFLARDPIPEPPLHHVRRLSYSSRALFARCSCRYHAQRVAGL